MVLILYAREENIVEKGENVGNQHVFFVAQYFKPFLNRPLL